MVRKLPITPVILLKILRHLDLNKSIHINFWAACLLMFFGMLRRSNVLPKSSSNFDTNIHLRRQDILFYPEGCCVIIRWSKTIQFQQRTLQIPLPRVHSSPLCPVQAIFRAFSVSPKASPQGPAFMINNSTTFSVLTFLKLLNQVLIQAGIDSEAYSGHSFRRGGATWAFHSGVSVETIRQLGDWKSNSYVKYIFESPSSIKSAFQTIMSNLPPVK